MMNDTGTHVPERGERSKKLFDLAKSYIPGGVNSPVRAFSGVGGNPFFVSRATGSRIHDVDGKEYIDYVCSWGPLILGHAHPEVMACVRDQTERGVSYGAPTEMESTLARMIVEALPAVELVRMVNSGTEATMSAIRLARGFTGRDIIIKFDGCYHGHVDHLLIQAGSGGLTLGVPDSKGVPADFARNTISLPYNDLLAVDTVVKNHRGRIACIILEPVCGNMGVVPPREGFLEGLREICDREDILLVFDEVITGFRVGYNGAQGRFGVVPDLTCLGKVIGGGFPVGAYGGRRDIMEQVAPIGKVYQAGTLSGNPVAMRAGIKTLEVLGREGVYDRLERASSTLDKGLTAAAEEHGVDVFPTRVGSMFSMFFTTTEVRDHATAKGSDTARYARFFWALQSAGVNLAPSQFESGFVSTAHSDHDIEETIAIADRAFGSMVSGGGG
ncbi:MAG: glutamate-1-semialdehyde 2,1-aminomutase [Candidatus Undinarchaeales archaeon]|jgi:glutamate-1-semialdehyde 2,1-aminomutase|nr:glutamate-1-semialdehyde 2,1-aminomutase [Candidatus Undinarchaeales archaeon]MDP7493881.1 glutamate-1-semialdehyde 2,1-aminomutase [Candidatus Undinarchaeales archaeon]